MLLLQTSSNFNTAGEKLDPNGGFIVFPSAYIYARQMFFPSQADIYSPKVRSNCNHENNWHRGLTFDWLQLNVILVPAAPTNIQVTSQRWLHFNWAKLPYRCHFSIIAIEVSHLQKQQFLGSSLFLIAICSHLQGKRCPITANKTISNSLVSTTGAGLV